MEKIPKTAPFCCTFIRAYGIIDLVDFISRTIEKWLQKASLVMPFAPLIVAQATFAEK